MKQVADGVWQLPGFPPNAINVYLVEDVLIDAATRHAGRRIARQLKGHRLSAHALTHAHADHQGASREICLRYEVPFWVGEGDVDAAEDPKLIAERMPKHPIPQLFWRIMAGPGHKVDRALREGDEVAGFRVLEVPGHSAGHVAFWRESDRVLILGDVLNNMDTLTGIPGLREPKTFFTPDPDLNRRSARKLLPLEPKLVLFGHGAPLRDTRKFVSFLERLPAERVPA
jgi:glyoxylase-like metal-dependent hydrolase (beta-lactamase superfamily II)